MNTSKNHFRYFAVGLCCGVARLGALAGIITEEMVTLHNTWVAVATGLASIALSVVFLTFVRERSRENPAYFYPEKLNSGVEDDLELGSIDESPDNATTRSDETRSI